MLEITNLHATVADKPILNGVSLHVPAGEVHAIMGPNGRASRRWLMCSRGGRV
jgi:ABC-type transport system involved in Fe-S cluster assembly, ATPase component